MAYGYYKEVITDSGEVTIEETNEYQLKRWHIVDDVPGGRVSTVFLSIDHGYYGEAIVYETMVFPDDSWTDLDCDRYATRAEAEAGHARMVEKYKDGVK